jgi:hypothetical protein
MFPIVESAHVIGLSRSVGLIALLDLRLIGAGLRHVTPWQIMSQLKPWYLAGFGGMFVTGALLFWAEAFSCYQSPAFRWKMLFLAVAGANAALFEVLYKPQAAGWTADDAIPRGAKAIAWCSLVCWAAIVGFGRWTAYRLG